jgi:hypothetical protein
VAIAGQIIPEHSARSWAEFAYLAALAPIKSVEDWYEYVERRHGQTGVTRGDIQILTRATDGNPGLISSLISGLVQNPTPA